jgi:hypothetical protein
MPAASVAVTSALTGAGGDGTDLRNDLLEVATGFRDQGGVGGDAIDQTGLGERPYVRHLGGIDEELHIGGPSCGKLRRAEDAGRVAGHSLGHGQGGKTRAPA